MLVHMLGLIFLALAYLAATALPASAQAACDRYASPTGTGNGLSQGTPYKIQNFWPQVNVTGGVKTLCLLDGTYQGSESMINPGVQGAPAGLSGNGTGADIKSGICPNCITLRALNDGKVTIDGQFTRHPICI